MAREFFVRFVNIFSELLIFAIFARVVFSWIPSLQRGRIYYAIISMTEPVLSAVRKITPKIGLIDISPILAIIGIEVARGIVLGLLL